MSVYTFKLSLRSENRKTTDLSRFYSVAFRREQCLNSSPFRRVGNVNGSLTLDLCFWDDGGTSGFSLGLKRFETQELLGIMDGCEGWVDGLMEGKVKTDVQSAPVRGSR